MAVQDRLCHLGALAGCAVFARMFLNPRQTRAGGKPACRPGVPKATRVSGRRSSKAQVDIAGNNQPGLPGHMHGSRDLGSALPENLLDSQRRCREVETAQERLPASVHHCTNGAGAPPPQRHPLGLHGYRACDPSDAGSGFSRWPTFPTGASRPTRSEGSITRPSETQSDVPRRHTASVRVPGAAHSLKCMDQAIWAEELARKLLEIPLPRRWAHVQGVAARARILGPDPW